jgi:alpha-galactosidase
MSSPVFVQEAPQVHKNGVAGTTLVSVFGSNQVAGNTNIVFIDLLTATPPAITSITDTQGNLYTLIGTITTSDCKTLVYSAPVASSAANSVTVVLAATTQYWGLWSREYSGVIAIDTFASNTGTSTSIACPITTANPNETLVACCRINVGTTLTPQGSLINQTVGASSDTLADQQVATAGTYTPTFSSSASGLWTIIAVALKGVAPTTPTVTVQAASPLDGTTATLNGNIAIIGTSTPTIQGFHYGLTASYGTTVSASGSFGVGAFSQNITGLTPGTLYHYQAFATNASGEGDSPDQTFVTSVPSNGLAPLPPMGWDSWRLYGQAATDAEMRTQAAAVVSSGLLAAGYNLFNINDVMYTGGSGGSLTTRGASFPNIPLLVTYIQSLGLKYAGYLAPGPIDTNNGCSGFPSSGGHETQHVALLMAQGTGPAYLMYDSCYDFGSPDLTKAAYATMAKALQASGNNIIFLTSAPVYADGATFGANSINWCKAAGGNVAWTWFDLGVMTWAKLLTILDGQIGLGSLVGPGRWNLPDFLGVGNGLLTDAEGRSNMCLWSILAAPLWAGCDLTVATAATLATLLNSEVIAVDQDPLGICGTQISHTVAGSAFIDVWARQLANGAWAVVHFNRDTASHPIPVTWAQLGLSGAYNVRDLLAHSNLGSMASGYTPTVATHDVAMVLITPVVTGPTYKTPKQSGTDLFEIRNAGSDLIEVRV